MDDSADALIQRYIIGSLSNAVIYNLVRRFGVILNSVVFLALANSCLSLSRETGQKVSQILMEVQKNIYENSQEGKNKRSLW